MIILVGRLWTMERMVEGFWGLERTRQERKEKKKQVKEEISHHPCCADCCTKMRVSVEKNPLGN